MDEGHFHITLDGIPLCQTENYFTRYGTCHYYGRVYAEVGLKYMRARDPSANLEVQEGRCQFYGTPKRHKTKRPPPES